MDATAETPPMPSHTRQRHFEIDGLRGWACVSVMFSHLFFGVFINVEPRFIPLDWRFLMEPFLGGTLAVAVFFVLSGDVLSSGYWLNPSRLELARHAVKRYARLTIPVVAASAIVFFLIETGLTFNHEAAPVLRVENWLGIFLTGDFSFLEMLWFSCVNVYFVGPTERALLPFLWTMRIEMLGSLLVLVYLFADFQIRRRYTAIVFMLLFCLAADSMLACFPIGMLCSAARANGVFDRLRRRPFAEPAAMAGFAAALVTGTWCNRTWEGFLAPSVVAGAVAVVCVYASANLTRFFSTPLSRWLGSISFPIFLLHFPVIVSFTSFLALWASARGMLTPGGIWAIVAVSGALCLLVSRIFRPVEAWAARAGNLTCDLMMRPHP